MNGRDLSRMDTMGDSNDSRTAGENERASATVTPIRSLEDEIFVLLESDNVDRGFTCDCQLNTRRLAQQITVLVQRRSATQER